VITTTIKHAIKLTIKLKTRPGPARLAGTPSLAATYNKMLMRAATVVQVLHGLFYVLLRLLVVAAIILSFIVSFIASFIEVVIPPLAVAPPL